MRAKTKPDGTLSDIALGDPCEGEVGLDEVAPHQPGDRLILDPENPRRAIVAAPPAPTYAERRAAEYPTADALVVALWERMVEGRPEASDALQKTRADVKAKYPKPGAA